MSQYNLKKIATSELAILIGIFLASLAFRVLACDVPINVDEHKWLLRGMGFLSQLADKNLAGTYLQHHPGVTSMWVNGTSIMVQCLLRDIFPSSLNLDQAPSLQACAQTLKGSSYTPFTTYVMARLLQGVITSACMVGLYVLARQLLGRPIALVGIGLLILEPFFLAYQRSVTTDAFQADFTILAVFLLLLYLRGDGNRRLLIGSGVCMGLAAASKTPALTVLPAIIVWVALIELGVWRTRFPRRGWLRQVVDLGLWGVSIPVTIFVIWPALWVAPVQTVLRLVNDLRTETERGELFFLGQSTESPGLLFYPLVLAYRLSPVLLVGVLLCLMGLLVPQLRRRLTQVPELMALLLVPLFVLFILSSSDNKIDRYLVSVIPALAFLAAAGWQMLWQVVSQRSVLSAENSSDLPPLQKGAKECAIYLLPLLAQLVILLPHYPYYLTYYNPLLGGTSVAQNLIMVGNGEGLDLAARWLNQMPNAKNSTVASWYLPSFAAYYQGKALDIPKTLEVDKNSKQKPWWEQADHVVLYINQYQRQLPDARLLAYFNTQQPIYTVRLHGVDYVKVYSAPVPSPEELKTSQESLFHDEEQRMSSSPIVSH